MPAGADRAFGFRRSVERLLGLDVRPETGGQLDGADAGVHGDQADEDVEHPCPERAGTPPKLVRVGVAPHLDDARIEHLDGMAEAFDLDGDARKGVSDEMDDGGAIDGGLVLVGTSRAA